GVGTVRFFDQRDQFLCQRVTPGTIVITVGINAMSARTIAIQENPDTLSCIYRVGSDIPARIAMVVAAIARYPIQHRALTVRLTEVIFRQYYRGIYRCRTFVESSQQCRWRSKLFYKLRLKKRWFFDHFAANNIKGLSPVLRNGHNNCVI